MCKLLTSTVKFSSTLEKYSIDCLSVDDEYDVEKIICEYGNHLSDFIFILFIISFRAVFS